jgi:hypothetical protein
MKKHTIYFLLAVVFISCRPDLNYEIHGYTQKIIVEGYISNGEFPKVYLSLNVPLSKQVDSVNILENVIRTAKVTISDSLNPQAVGAKTEILTSGWDKTHFPPYVYRGTDIKGEEGKTYYLTVDYSGYTLHAKTTIPTATRINEFTVLPVSGNDSLRILYMTFNIDPTLKNSYRVATKKRKDNYYINTPFLYNSEFTLSGANTFTISPQATEKDSSFSEGSYFAKGDTIQIQFSTIDSISTQFFKSLTLFSASTGIGNIYFIGEKEALKSNISTPGFGIWYGKGNTDYTYIIP